MAARKEEGGPGGKRKRQAEAEQNEGEEDAADAGSKRLKHLDDVETSSGQQDDGSQRKKKQVTGSAEDERAASKSGEPWDLMFCSDQFFCFASAELKGDLNVYSSCSTCVVVVYAM